MNKRIFLKCLKKDSNTYNFVRLLKRHGSELEINEPEEIKKLHSVISALYPSVVVEDSKVSLSPAYDFILTDIKYAMFLHKECEKYNRKIEDYEEIKIPKILDD